MKGKKTKCRDLLSYVAKKRLQSVSGGVKKDMTTHTESYSFRYKEGTCPFFFKVCKGT